MKSCNHPDCHYPVFSKGLCSVHWKYKHGKPLPRVTEKRSKQISEYMSRRQQFINERRAESHGKLWCAFCTERIYGDPDIHHTIGRDDETLLDEKYWHVAHWKCHVPGYHSKSCNDIVWWDRYMIWLKENMPPEVYLKELKRKDKS